MPDTALLVEGIAITLGACYVLIGRWRRRIAWVISGLALVVAPILTLPRLGFHGCLVVLVVVLLFPLAVGVLESRRSRPDPES